MNYPDLLDFSQAKDDLEMFVYLTLRWTKKINLIGNRSSSEIWERHILDSVQVFHVKQMSVGHHVDIGSGGGFPGLVVAILNKAYRPLVETTLVEADQRKATFLRTSIRTLNLNARVIVGRIENVEPLSADLLTARALAPLPKLLYFVERHMSMDGRAFLWKGKSWKQEVEDSKIDWSFSVKTHKSKTNFDSRILEVERLCRVQ